MENFFQNIYNLIDNDNIDSYNLKTTLLNNKNNENNENNIINEKHIVQNLNENIIDTINKKIKNSKVKKIKNDNNKNNIFSIPKYSEYEMLNTEKYTAIELKQICKYYKLKVSGKKQILIERIYNYLKKSYYAIKIQSLFRCYLIKTYMKLHGIYYKLSDRKKCVNECDFLSLDDIKTIPFKNFITIQQDKFVYGFDLTSIYDLLKREGRKIKNPYNRESLNEKDIMRIKKLKRYNILLKLNSYYNKEKSDIYSEYNEEQKFKLFCVSVFQKIDELGHYTDINWFLSLNKYNLIRFVRELIDIWNYRASITPETKQKIYPNGDIFNNIRLQRFFIMSENEVKKVVIKLIDKFISNGINNESKNLGAIYVLGALTIVNKETAEALPWLYETFRL